MSVPNLLGTALFLLPVLQFRASVRSGILQPELVHRVSRLRRRAGAAELLAGWFPLVAKTRRRLGPHPFATVRLKHCSSLARRRSCVLQILGECRRRSRYGGRGRHSPTRRISEFSERLTSTRVGMASWSMSRWSRAQRLPPPIMSEIPCSRLTRIHRRGLSGSICWPESNSGWSATSC